MAVTILLLCSVACCKCKRKAAEEGWNSCAAPQVVAKQWQSNPADRCVAMLVKDPTKRDAFAMVAFEESPAEAYAEVASLNWKIEGDVLKTYALYGIGTGDYRVAQTYLDDRTVPDDIAVRFGKAAAGKRPGDILAMGVRMDLGEDDDATRTLRHLTLQAISDSKTKADYPLAVQICTRLADEGQPAAALGCVTHAARLGGGPRLEHAAARALANLSAVSDAEIRTLQALGISFEDRLGPAASCGGRLPGPEPGFDPTIGTLDLDLILNLAGSAPVKIAGTNVLTSPEGLCYFRVAAMSCLARLMGDGECSRPDALTAYAAALPPQERDGFVDTVFDAKTGARLEGNAPAAFALHVTLANLFPEVDGVKGAKFQREQAAIYWARLHPGIEFPAEQYFAPR